VVKAAGTEDNTIDFICLTGNKDLYFFVSFCITCINISSLFSADIANNLDLEYHPRTCRVPKTREPVQLELFESKA